MCSFYYRLKQSIVGLELDDNGRAALVTIPAGADLVVGSVQPDGDRFVVVIWKGRTIQLFSSDLDERATQSIAGGRAVTTF